MRGFTAYGVKISSEQTQASTPSGSPLGGVLQAFIASLRLLRTRNDAHAWIAISGFDPARRRFFSMAGKGHEFQLAASRIFAFKPSRAVILAIRVEHSCFD